LGAAPVSCANASLKAPALAACVEYASEGERLAVAQRAHEHLVAHQALQDALRPAEEMRPRVHAQRRVEVEDQALELQHVGQREVRPQLAGRGLGRGVRDADHPRVLGCFRRMTELHARPFRNCVDRIVGAST